MSKLFQVIYFSFFVAWAMAAGAAHQDAILQERAAQNYAHFEREVGQIYEQSRHVTYSDFASAVDLAQKNIKDFFDKRIREGGSEANRKDCMEQKKNLIENLNRNLLEQEWKKLQVLYPKREEQGLILSVAIEYLRRPPFSALSSKFFSGLSSYRKEGYDENFPIMWAPQGLSVVALSHAVSISDFRNPHEIANSIKNDVICLKGLTPEIFKELFCTNFSSGNPLEKVAENMTRWDLGQNIRLPPERLECYMTCLYELRVIDLASRDRKEMSLALSGASPEKRGWIINKIRRGREGFGRVPEGKFIQLISSLIDDPHLTEQKVDQQFNRLMDAHRPMPLMLHTMPLMLHMPGHQGSTRSIAMETHNYADQEVDVPGAACAAGASSQMRVIDAVFGQVEGRLGARAIVPFSEVHAALGRFSSAPAFQSVLENPADQDLMAIIYTFLKAFYPDKVDLWKAQFIRESEEAYRGRHDPTSCVKGIRERIITGLRGIDPELDRTFAQVEGRHLMRARATGANPRENPQALARQLLELGIRPTTPVAEAAARFKSDFEDKLKTYGLEVDAEFKGQADIFAELIEGELGNAQSALSQALKSEFNKGNWKKAFKAIKKQNREGLVPAEETPAQRRALLAKAAEDRLART